MDFAADHDLLLSAFADPAIWAVAVIGALNYGFSTTIEALTMHRVREPSLTSIPRWVSVISLALPIKARCVLDASSYGQLEAGFTPERVELMFDTFRHYNIANGNWSTDWENGRFNWVDRQVNIVNERDERERARAYWRARR